MSAKAQREYRRDMKTLKRYYDGCRQCGKTNDEVPLSLCAGCGMHRYCSKECQRKAWPRHKEMCLQNQKNLALPDKQPMLKKLNAFTQKHKPYLHKAGIIGLDVVQHINHCNERVLVILIREREASDERSKKPERAYRCEEALVMSMDVMDVLQPDISAPIRKEMAKTNTPEKIADGRGSVYVAVMLLGGGTPTLSLCGFPFNLRDAAGMEKLGDLWKADLFVALNMEWPTEEELSDKGIIVIAITR